MRSPAGPADGRRATSFGTLDLLRGIAALGVVLLHFRPLFAPIQVRGAYLAVDLFFLISGFVLAHAYDQKLRDGMTLGAFLKARIVRLGPFYILAAILGIAELAYLNHTRDIGDLVAISGALSLFLIPTPPIGFAYNPLFPGNVVFWTLFFELVVNALYAATIKWQTRTGLIRIVIVAGLALSVLGWARGNLNGGGFWVDGHLGFTRALFSFSAGVLLCRLDLPRRSAGSRLAGTMAVAIVGIALFVPVPIAARGFVDPLLVLFVFPAVLVLATLRAPQPATRIERILGEVSYPLYVLQMPVFTALILAIQRFAPGLIDRAAPWLGIVALAAFSAACGFVATRWERPLRRWLDGSH